MSNLLRCQNGHLFSSRRYGTVCPYCNIETATEEKQGLAGKNDEELEALLLAQEVSPVCGWIVCISGARQGKGYEIKSGKNFVGRADDMDIQILGDNKISRRNHGVIVFDPKKKETVLLPGDSNGLVYHNDAAVYTPTVLNSYDVIEMGDSKFVFVPFCGENFMWEDNQAPSGGERMTIPEYISAMLCAIGLMMIVLRLCMTGHRNTFRGGKRPYWCEYGASKTIGTREVQEDEYGILETQEGIMAVLADGMGKHYGGKIASRAAVEVFKDIFDDENAFYNPQYYLRKAFQGANREILNLIEDGHGQACVAAVLIKDNRMYYASAGNVKIAVYRNKELVPVTAGHTINVLAKKQYTEGKLSRQDAAALMEHHRLYNYVGQDGFHDIEFFDTPIALNGGEYILLMSDGMYEEVRWKEMEDCLEQEGTCQQKAFALVELVNQSDSEDKDNASVAVLKIKGKK